MQVVCSQNPNTFVEQFVDAFQHLALDPDEQVRTHHHRIVNFNSERMVVAAA